jgi:hypothetical protein
MKFKFTSSTPASAQERIKKRYPNGAKKQADYYVKGNGIGRRFFAKEGYVDMEYGIRNGRMQGMMYT